MSTHFLTTDTLVLLLIASTAGLCAALIAWMLSRSWAAVPEEDRAYKDIPPLGFRLLWAPVRWLAHYIEPRLSVRTSRRLARRLMNGGLEFSVSPAQFVAARCLGVVLMALFGFEIAAVLDRQDELPLWGAMQVALAGAVFGWMYPAIWLRDRIMLRKRELLKALPFYLDIITLCVEGGLNLHGAISQAVAKGPKGVLRDEFQRVMRDIRAGKPRAEALRGMGKRIKDPGVTAFCSAVIQAEAMGMSLGPILRAQADQRRVERFLRAEKMAMEAPVKLLFPLIAFIFPCTFIVLFFPIVIKFMHSGL